MQKKQKKDHGGKPFKIRPRKPDSECKLCVLHKTSETVCCQGAGPRDAEIWLWGEALGAREEAVGRPFVGDAGHKLNYLLKLAGLRRKQLRIENMVRCRPPGNGKPTARHVTACYGYTLRDILAHKPKVIVALGATAYQGLTGQVVAVRKGEEKVKLGTRSVREWRGFYERLSVSWESPAGKIFTHECWIVPTYHPSACLRNWELDDLVVFDLSIAKELTAGRELLSEPDTRVTAVKTLEEAKRLIARLRKQQRFVIDLETTGLNPHEDQIMCFGFCYRAGESWVLPWMRQGRVQHWTPAERAVLVGLLTELIEGAELVGQNAKFDVQFLRKLLGVVDPYVAFDTMIAHANVDENKPHSLTFLCQWYLKWGKYDAAMDPWKVDGGFRTWEVPDGMLWRYCGIDCDGTWRLRKRLVTELQREKVEVAFVRHMGLVLPLADVEYRGLQCDRERLLHLSGEFRSQAQAIRARLQKRAVKYVGEGTEFNPGSPKQLGTLLVAAGAMLTKKTATRQISTDKFVLEALSLKSTPAGRIARDVIAMRKIEGYVGKNLDGAHGNEGFVQYLHAARFHPTYNIHITRTGRLSANNPPIQTAPRTGAVRSIVVPDSDGHVILSADYEKIELYVLAWLSNERVMLEELTSGVDLHTRMAVVSRLMRDPTEAEWERIAPEITKDERSVAKGVNFGIPYGRGAWAIAEASPDAFPLTMVMRDREARVQRVIDAYFRKYQRVAEYRERQIELVEQRGVLVVPFTGRKRRLAGAMRWFGSRHGMATDHHDRDLSHVHREAYNFRVQALAGEILTRATRRVFDGIREARIPGLRIILTLHDQLAFSCYRKHADEARELIVEQMADRLPKMGSYKYEVDLRVECVQQRCFGEEYQSPEEKQEYQEYLQQRGRWHE